jgi:uncharacterized membrane protein
MAAASADASPPPDEPAHPAATSQAPRVRLGIETISDVVFGLSLEIGSIALVAKLPQSAGDLARDVVEFGFTFVIIFMVWFAYRRTAVVFSRETQSTLIVNVALLFCVAIEPFLFYVTVAGTGTGVGGPASMGLALDVGAMMLLLAAFFFLLLAEETEEPHRKTHPTILRQMWVANVGRIFVGAAFLVSALPLFDTPGLVGSTVREDFWLVLLGLFFVVQFGSRLFESRPTSAGS